MRRPVMSLLALWSPLTLADGGIANKVYNPYVQPLEREIEYRSSLVNDDDPALDGLQVHQVAFGASLNDRWFIEFYAIGERSRGNSLSVSGFETELKWQLTEQGEYAVDWGMLFELEIERDTGARELSATLLAEKEFGRWAGRANLGVVYEWGNDIANEWESELALQWRYRYRREFEPAIELYSSDFAKGLGPVAIGAFSLGPRRKLLWEAGVIMGIDSDSPDQTVRLLLEYEF